jgi:hypothetical protein
MGWQRAFPYATDDSAVKCTTSSANPKVFQRSDDTWDAFSNDVGNADFDVVIKVDEDRLQACLPPGLQVSDSVELAVTLEGIQARTRRELFTLDVGDHDIELKLEPTDYIGKVDVSVTARLKTALEPRPGFAHLESSRIAHAPVATIWFTEPPQSVGDALEIRWEDFDEDGDLVDGHLFAIRMEERPVIILNSAIPSAYDILQSKGTHGAAARIRDAIFGQIIHQAWSSILSHCLHEIALHDEDETAETVLAELDDWQAQVIKAWAPTFIPSESDPETAALMLIEQARETGNLLLMHQLPEAIQSKCATISGFNGLIREFDRFEGGA